MARAVVHGEYRVAVEVTPNAGGLRPNAFVVRTTRDGRRARAAISVRLFMPAMAMPPLGLRLRETSPGVSQGVGEVLTMPGRWEVRLHVAPRGAPAFDVLLVDTVRL